MDAGAAEASASGLAHAGGWLPVAMAGATQLGAIGVCCARYVVPTGVPSWRGAV